MQIRPTLEKCSTVKRSLLNFVVVSMKMLRINNDCSSAPSTNTVLLLGYSHAEERESLVPAK